MNPNEPSEHILIPGLTFPGLVNFKNNFLPRAEEFTFFLEDLQRPRTYFEIKIDVQRLQRLFRNVKIWSSRLWTFTKNCKDHVEKIEK